MMSEAGIDFLKYQEAKEKREHAYTNYNWAGDRLKLAQIMERAAELQSQTIESVGKGHLCNKLTRPTPDHLLKHDMLKAVEYVVFGRCS